jgi:hypothetical protein
MYPQHVSPLQLLSGEECSNVGLSLEINFWRGIVPFLVPALPKYVSRQKAAQLHQRGPVLGKVHLAKGPFSVV